MAAGHTRHVVHHVLHRQKLFCWVERRLFVLAAGLGFLTWDLTHHLPAAVLLFLPLYAGAYWSTQRDPQLLQILLTLVRSAHRHGLRLRSEFDPLQHAPVTLTVRR
jgi:type IV secretory system VirB3-like protein